MRKYVKLTMVLIMGLVVLSCGKTKKKNSGSVTKTEKKPVTGTEEKNAKFNQWKEKLKHTEPLAFEDLKAWLPKSLGGIPLTSSRSLLPMFKGQSEILGRYDNLKSSRLIGLNLFDAAGPEGGSFCDQITEYRKARPDQEVGGIQMRTGFKVKDWSVRQSHTPEKNFTTISFFHDDRILVKLTANNFSVEESWDLIGELDFRSLSELIKE